MNIRAREDYIPPVRVEITDDGEVFPVYTGDFADIEHDEIPKEFHNGIIKYLSGKVDSTGLTGKVLFEYTASAATTDDPVYLVELDDTAGCILVIGKEGTKKI